jgi:hypothetical protein
LADVAFLPDLDNAGPGETNGEKSNDDLRGFSVDSGCGLVVLAEVAIKKFFHALHVRSKDIRSIAVSEVP